MKKIWLFGTLCLMLMCLCACMNGNEELTTSEEMTTNFAKGVQRYIISIRDYCARK